MQPFFVFILFLFSSVSIAQTEKKDISYVFPFYNESVSWYRVKKSDRVGVIAKDSTLITGAIFSYIDQFRNNYAQAGILTKGKMFRGVINDKGETIIPIKYDDVFLNDNSVVVSLQNKYGVVNYKNEMVLPINYDLIRKYGAFYLVINDNKIALFTIEKGFVSDFIFTDLQKVYNELIVMRDNQFQYVIDEDGEIVYQTDFKEELFDIKNHLMIVKTDEHVKLFDLQKKTFSDYSYEEMYFTHHALKVKFNSQYGIVDYNNNTIVPLVYDNIYSIDENAIVKKGNYYGAYYKNELKLPVIYKDIHLHKNGNYLFVTNEHKNNGLYNLNFDSVIPETGKILSYNEDSYVIEQDKLLHIFNIKTEELIPLETKYSYKGDTDYMLGLNSSFYILMKKDNKFGALNYEGKVAIPFEYDELIGIYTSPKFIAKKNGKYGIIDKDNAIEKAFIYDEAELVKEVVFLYKNNKKVDSYSVTFN